MRESARQPAASSPFPRISHETAGTEGTPRTPDSRFWFEKMKMLTPMLVTTLRGYSRQQFVSDLIAGVIVGIVALPLTIAFAIASGLPPIYGLYTGVIAGFIISVLGGSSVQIGGPTGAFVVIVYGIVQQYGVDGLTVATIMAGVLLVAFGLARLGGAIKFIPYPVTLGFTAGIAVTVATSQLPDFFGLTLPHNPAEFLPKPRVYWESLGTINTDALTIAGISMLVLVAWPRFSRQIPGPVIALIIGTAVAHLFKLDVETIGSRFGDLTLGVPQPRIPEVSFSEVVSLIGPAITIALLGGIESLLSAVVADGMLGSRHRSNMELVAQGVANIAAPIFGGMPATGAIARTATNIKNGGRTPVAGMVHAITLLLIALFFGRWVAYIPLAVLASILLVVAYHMSEWRRVVAEFRAPRSDVLVMLTTLSLTVLVDLTVAIQVGMVLAAFLFMRRMSEVTNVSAITAQLSDEASKGGTSAATLEGVQIYTIDGPFFFGAADKFKEVLGRISSPPRVLILDLANVPAIDSTGMAALRDVIRKAHRDRTRVILVGVHAQPMVALGRTELLDVVGDENLFGTVQEALAALQDDRAEEARQTTIANPGGGGS